MSKANALVETKLLSLRAERSNLSGSGQSSSIDCHVTSFLAMTGDLDQSRRDCCVTAFLQVCGQRNDAAVWKIAE